MELFYTKNINGNIAIFDPQESRHCVKVLRHHKGDTVEFVDGLGTLYRGVITDLSPIACKVEISERESGLGERNYYLHMAVAPVKNPDRYEWFMEKATELGFDRLTPVVGEFSERRRINTERGERLLISAAKQSLKAMVPQLDEAAGVKDFILSMENFRGIKLIGHCREGEKRNLMDILAESKKEHSGGKFSQSGEKQTGERPFGEKPSYVVMIGPEGDFSAEEIELAVSKGFIPVTMGQSRLRSETAALCAVTGVYLTNI